MYYRRMDLDSAFDCARRGLAVDAYDPASNYLYGLAARQLGKPYDARDGFGVAARSPDYRDAANVQLSEMAILDSNWAEAKFYAQRASHDAPAGAESTRLLALVGRLSGDTAGARVLLGRMLAEDPLCHFARCELYLLSPTASTRSALVSGIRSELPHETYIELATLYARLGLTADALSVLEPAAGNPMADFWRAYLTSLQGDPAAARRLLEGALETGPAFVFPHRREEMTVLRWAEHEHPHWKTEYYLALLNWSLGRTAESERWFAACGERPDFAPFYIARAVFRNGDPEGALTDYRRALAIDPGEWRTHNAIVTFLNERGRSTEALPIARAAAARFPQSYIMQFLLARTLLVSDRPAEALGILDTLAILPFEGARYGRDAYRQACIGSALRALGARDTSGALGLIEHARLWPERLGAGEPYNADTRPEDYMQARIWRARGDTSRAGAMLRKIIDDSGSRRGPANAQDLIGACALRDLGKQALAEKYLSERMGTDRENPLLAWCLSALHGRPARARAIESKLQTSILNPFSGDQDFLLVTELAAGGTLDAP